ncbi:hypothetical protein [Pseudaquabacterium pictum]|uniref:DUF5666 domain-containing protein n=1 Tax=Pseudaquabacterium pictum TaxID=2315236 RepID=A0A480ASS4_9BURK|nr:hypothetical protein [Rubrivivax pictus]GCL64729.1 hypothetical protein AQPW35_38100 [Rubrivivax pictus]
MMKNLLAVVVLGLSALSLNAAFAHGGAKAKHGGVVAIASDLGFELVGTPAGASIYIEDHGKPMAPAGMSGKLTVLNGAEKSEAELAVAGDRLEAKGVKLAPGAKVVAVLTTPAKKAITVRFTVK